MVGLRHLDGVDWPNGNGFIFGGAHGVLQKAVGG
jgi:hypothetical protein